MKSKETNVRDHETDSDAFNDAIRASRRDNAAKQADLAVGFFGRDRINPDPADKPDKDNNRQR